MRVRDLQSGTGAKVLRPPGRPFATASADYASRLAEWQAWEAVSIAAHGTPDGDVAS